MKDRLDLDKHIGLESNQAMPESLKFFVKP